jgi:hypothetical protein
MSSTKSDWLIPGALIALSMVPAVAGIVRLAQLASRANITPENARFFAAPLPVLLHIPAVIVYSILGAFQFSPGFRRRWRGWHRAAGDGRRLGHQCRRGRVDLRNRMARPRIGEADRRLSLA